MPKDGEKKKKKHQRKRRVQLDDMANYYRNVVSDDVGESSVSTRSATESANRLKVSSMETTPADPDIPSTSLHTTEPTTSATSDPQKTPEHNATSPTRAGSTSPEPNCAICLGKLENKSFTDSCFHQFCFDCLVEWSKVKAECPLCKQPFKSIVHNVRSYNDYDQYHIPRPEERVSLPEHIFGPNLSGVRFRYRTTVTDHRYAHVADRINREIELRLLQRPSRASPIPNYRRLRQPANSEFRRRVYEEHLQRTGQEHNTRRRVRDTSPTFFQNNPAQTHRLVPWLNRELNALQTGQQVAFILDLIMDLIKRYPIDSEEFYQHVFPYVGRHTRHFMREFLMFARSPYHMAAYDRHCAYEPSNERNHDSDSDSDHQRPDSPDDGNDSDVIVCERTSQPSTQPTPSLFSQSSSILADPFSTHSHTHTHRSSRGLFGDTFPASFSSFLSSGLPTFSFDNSGIFSASTSFSAPFDDSQVLLPPVAPVFPSFPSSFNFPTADPQQGTSTAHSPMIHTEPIVCNDSESETSTSDVEIVDIEKPWHERSPIHLSSAQDSDSDVMITGTTYLTDPVKKEKKKKKKDKRQRDNEHSGRKLEKRKRNNESSQERNDPKRPNRAATEDDPSSRSRSRSRSISPLRLTIIKSPNYQHKKFMYKSHGDEPEKRDRRSESSTDSDSESQHVSITSHRRKSKTNRSSIEIVEYRKKKSKSKKSKKHKKDKKHEDIIEFENNSNSEDQVSHKHKKSSKSASLVQDRGSGHSSSASHSKHKHKSKKKKHKHGHKESKSSKTPSLNIGDKKSYKSILDVYTSDSELDSDIDVVGKVSQKASESTVRGEGLVNSGVEFVELNAAQAAVIDQELDHINKTLASSDYITSLMSDGGNSSGKGPQCIENNDPNRLVNPDDVLNLRSFKKHPYGHKKSSKNSKNCSATTFSSNDTHNLVNSISQLSQTHTADTASADNIQISDISSCTDNDLDRQLPSFLTFSNRRADVSNNNIELTNPFDCHQRRIADILSGNTGSRVDQLLNNESYAYESPTSTEPPSVKVSAGTADKDSEIIDVDTLDSDSETPDDHFDVGKLIYRPTRRIRSGIDNSELDLGAAESYDSNINVTELDSSYDSIDSSSRINDITTINNNSASDIKLANDSAKLGCSSKQIVDDNNDYVDVVNDNNTNEQIGSDGNNVVNHSDSDIDVENEDSDIECSLVEGHKTFEIETDSDGEVDNKTDGHADLDVVGCSDDDIVVDDGDQSEVVSVGTDEKNDSDLSFNSFNSKSDTNSLHDDGALSTSPAACDDISQVETNQAQTEDGNLERDDATEYDMESDANSLNDNSTDEPKILDVVNGKLNSSFSDHCDENSDDDDNNEDEDDDDKNSLMNIGDSIDSDRTPDRNLGCSRDETGVSNTSSNTISPNESAVSWASQSVYETGQIGLSGSTDSLHQPRQSGTPDHYVIDSLSNADHYLSSRSVSPASNGWDRHSTSSLNSHDGDFQPED